MHRQSVVHRDPKLGKEPQFPTFQEEVVRGELVRCRGSTQCHIVTPKQTTIRQPQVRGKDLDSRTDPLWSKNSSRLPRSRNSLLFAQGPLKIKQGREVFCQGRFPASFIYALCAAHCPLSRRFLCRFPLVILQQAAQSFLTPHCSLFPSCLRLRRKQYSILFALMVPLFMVMHHILLQGSPQRRLTK